MNLMKNLSVLGVVAASFLFALGCSQNESVKNKPADHMDMMENNESMSPPAQKTATTTSPKEARRGYAMRAAEEDLNPSDFGARPRKATSSLDLKTKPNPLNVERFAGEIIDKKITINPDGSRNVTYKVDTGNRVLTVFTNADRYAYRRPMSLEIGDRIEFKGSRMEVNGTELMMATEINRGGVYSASTTDMGNYRWTPTASDESKTKFFKNY